MDANLYNFEELLRSWTDCVQILSLLNGIGLLFVFWIPAAIGLQRYSLKILLFALCLVMYSMFVPGFLSLLQNQGQDVFLLEAIVTPATIFVGALACFAACFLPTIIAVSEKRTSKVWIIFLNCFFLIPVCWLGSYVWACMSNKPKSELANAFGVAEGTSAAVLMAQSESQPEQYWAAPALKEQKKSASGPRVAEETTSPLPDLVQTTVRSETKKTIPLPAVEAEEAGNVSSQNEES